MINNYNTFLNRNITFSGTTKIYALTDSHQQTRGKCALLTKILEDGKQNKNVLALDGGDLFKGIYPPELEIQSYITLKKEAPDLEIVINIGNNDPGYKEESYEFFKKSIKTLTDNGIHVISANTWDKNTNQRIEGVKPYVVINRDGDRILVTGFCVNNLTQTTYGVKSEDPIKVLANLKQAILDEKPDGLIIMSHDWFAPSEKLMKFAQEQGLKVDLMIGGHEHNAVKPDYANRIYYPGAFNSTMYKFDLVINNKNSQLKNIEVLKNENLKVAPEFEKNLKHVEEKAKLLEGFAPSVLNLTKRYSNPCPLGTFMADAMRNETKSDIAFFSTGFLMSPLPYKPGEMITNFDLEKTITGHCPIEKITVTPDTLKEIFQNALENRYIKDKANSRFLQCSRNVKLVGTGDPESQIYSLKQIYINDEPLFDEETGKALDPKKQITCAIDSYIGRGGQAFTMLKDIPKDRNVYNGGQIDMEGMLRVAIKKAAQQNPEIREYPSFELIDI